MNHVAARSDRCPLDFNGPESHGRSKKAATLQGSGVHLAYLRSMRRGICLEIMGYPKIGKSYVIMVRKMFKLGSGASRTEVLARLQQEIEEFQRG